MAHHVNQTIARLIEGLPITLAAGDGEVVVAGVKENSANIEPGDLFIARVGAKSDGRAFIDHAVNAGAAAVLTDASARVPPGAAALICDHPDTVPHQAALLAERFHGRPSEQLTVIGVTGTNGKSTVAHLIRDLLRRAGRRCGLIGTIEVDDTVESTPAALTTPPAHELSAMLRRMVDHGCDACVMEVSSHAIAQHRTSAMSFDAAVFTNLSGDHLDYHASMSDYAQTKSRLFAQLDKAGIAVINADDDAAPVMQSACRAAVARCSLREVGDWNGRVLARRLDGIDLHIAGPWGERDVHLPLLGEHNAMNALQAMVVGRHLGIDEDALIRAMERCTAPPGRLEAVTPAGHPFVVLVDYAHTDDALDKALAAVRPVVPVSGRLRVVFGCGGERDESKRPRMARAVMRWADQAVITSDNPRGEDPNCIMQQVFNGVPHSQRESVVCEIDRRAAIESAIADARPGDVIVIAGKGHEPYQIIGDETLAFDDRDVARRAVESTAIRAETA